MRSRPTKGARHEYFTASFLYATKSNMWSLA